MASKLADTRRNGLIKTLRTWVFGSSYTTRVTITFALVAALTAIVAMGVLSFVWEQHFQNYTHENIQALADRTASAIADKYERSNGRAIDAVDTTGIGTYPALSMSDVAPASAAHTLNQTMGIQVVGVNNIVVYDSTLIMGTNEASGTITNVGSLARGSDATMARADIMVHGTTVGRVNMWVYGSEVLLSKTDQEFRNQSYQAMAFAATLSIVLASLLGFLFARSLVRPIVCMTKTAAAIKEGNLSARTNLEGEDEIAELGKTFDAMASSVEKDRELERRLTTDVAHELRTPLMAIQSTVEAIVDGVFEPTAERLGTVDSEVQRLSRMVDALLKLSRLENRTTPLNEEVLNLGEMIRTIALSHEAYIADAGLELSYSAEDEVIVYADRDLIRQATANLISNAVRYTPAPGSIFVSVRKNDAEAMISVQDTGVGLSEEECKMVFSRFWRADSSRERASGGLGIGLSVVKEIVDRHRGWVEVRGAKGEGACFTIHIPLYDYERIKTMREKESTDFGADAFKGGIRSKSDREGLIG